MGHNKIPNMGDKANSNGFAKNPEKAGRPRKNRLEALIASEIGEAVTPAQLRAANAALLNMSEKELYSIKDCKDKDKYPFYIVTMVEALIKEKKAGTADTVFKLLERAAGRAPQHVEVSGEIATKPNIETLSPEEKIALLSILEKIAPEENSKDND